MKNILLSAVLLFTTAMSSMAQDYGKQLDKTWQQIFKMNPKDGVYRWSGYPVDNFGILTAYDPPTGKVWTDADRICATWRCIDRSTQIPDDPKQRLQVADFVDPGEGGSVTLSDSQQKKLGLNLLLPGLAQILNLKAGINWSKGITTKVTIEKAYKRSADRNKYQTFIANESQNSLLKRQFTNGRLAWIAADIVAEGITLEILIDKKKNANAEAELKTAAGKVLPAASKLNFEWTSAQNGGMKLIIKHPVVLAMLTRTQPEGGALTAKDPVTDANLIYDKPVPRTTFQNGEPTPKQ